jgi:PEP-CTERM motif
MIYKLVAAAAALVLAAAAHADTVVFQQAGSTGDLPTTTSAVLAPFSSPSGTGTLSFTLDGYNTLDGQNFYEDDFTLTVNGTAILSGTFNLGGGGNNVVFSSPAGTVITGLNTDPNSVTAAGGALQFTVPVSLLATGNSVAFSYLALGADTGHAGFQDLGDEGWGVSDITVTAAAVPEAGSLAMMLAGLGMVGGLARRRAARRA